MKHALFLRYSTDFMPLEERVSQSRRHSSGQLVFPFLLLWTVHRHSRMVQNTPSLPGACSSTTRASDCTNPPEWWRTVRNRRLPGRRAHHCEQLLCPGSLRSAFCAHSTHITSFPQAEEMTVTQLKGYERPILLLCVVHRPTQLCPPQKGTSS